MTYPTRWDWLEEDRIKKEVETCLAQSDKWVQSLGRLIRGQAAELHHLKMQREEMREELHLWRSEATE